MDNISKEDHLPATYKELAELYRKNQQFNRTIEEITLSIISESDINTILDRLLDRIGELIPYSSANIMLLEEGTIKTLRWKGYEKYGAEEFISTFSVVTTKSGKVPYLLKRKKIELVTDAYADPEWKTFKETAYIRSALIAPLMWEDTVIGILFLDSDKAFSFTEEDKNTLQLLLPFASTAISKSVLFHKAEKEIERRKEAEKKLQRSLKIQGILIREINHRVKNNLSIILALIHMQGDKLFDRYHESLLEDLERRVYAISLVHETLMETSDPSNIDLESYIMHIIDFVRSSGIYRGDIRFSIKFQNGLLFKMDTLLSLGLIISEIISNSMVHAFPESGGEILLAGFSDKGTAHIRISDTGTGFPPGIITADADESTAAGGGIHLILTLTDQIKGTIVFSNDGGAVTDLTFPV